MSDDEIRDLWKDPNFSGSFSGILTFQQQLLHDKNIKISTRRLRHILTSLPDYLQHITRRKHFPKRSYSVHGWMNMIQADLTQPKPAFNGFKYLMVVIDVYTLYLWAMPLKDKRPKSIENEFRKIFESNGTPQELATDEGGEFVGCKKYFESQNIFWSIKRGAHKAAFAELAIRWIKQKVFAYLHSTNQDKDEYNWPKAVPAAVLSLNSTFHQSLGQLRPIDLNSPEKAVLIDRKIGFPKEPNFDDIERNKTNFAKNTDLNINDHVYVVAKKRAGALRSSDRQVFKNKFLK